MRSFYLQFHVNAIWKWPFSRTYPLIYSHPWSFYIQIRDMRAYFWSPYLSNITRSNCITIIVLEHRFWRPKSPTVLQNNEFLKILVQI